MRHCPRCDDWVRTLEPWRHWTLLFRAWLGGLVVFLAASPFVIGDFCVVQPCLMLYLIAGSILRRHTKEKPVCRRCSLELEPSLSPRPPVLTEPPAAF